MLRAAASSRLVPCRNYGAESALQYWPLQPGWQSQAVVATGWSTVDIGGRPETGLPSYGPGVVYINSSTYFYTPASATPREGSNTTITAVLVLVG